MLLTLDISTVQTGYCVGALGRRPRWGVMRPGNLPRDERIAYMAESVVQMVKATGADQVVAEQVSVGHGARANFNSAVALAEAHGAIRYALRPTGLTMATMNLATARKELGIRLALGIKGNPKKEDARRWLTAQGYPTVNGDEADALVLWLAVTMGRTGTTMQPQLRPRLSPQRTPGQTWLEG